MVLIKKVTVIENWILNAVQKKNVANRVLLLTGPSGVGKSTIVDVLSQELNINIREWRDNASDGNRFQRMGKIKIVFKRHWT